MPERRGRKRRHRERREGTARGSSAPVTSPATASPAAKPAQTNLPSRNARLSGLALAIFTGVLAAMLVYGAFSGDNSSGETAFRALLGAVMVGLAIFVGVLVLFPAQLRDYFQRRRDRAAAR